jgi:hypothetical protein
MTRAIFQVVPAEAVPGLSQSATGTSHNVDRRGLARAIGATGEGGPDGDWSCGCRRSA